jgi:hypothetical protein
LREENDIIMNRPQIPEFISRKGIRKTFLEEITREEALENRRQMEENMKKRRTGARLKRNIKQAAPENLILN